MQKMLGMLGAVVAVAGVASAAQAQEARWPKWYLGVSGSVPFVSENEVEQGGTSMGDVSFDSGWGASAALGYMPSGGDGHTTAGIWDLLRLEFEYLHRENDIDSVSSRTGLIDGNVKVNAYMGNVYYDFDSNTGFKPYLGLGVGYANLDMGSTALGVKGDDNVFAYQALAGVYYEPDLIPYTQWGFGYRYFGTTDPEVGTGAAATSYTYQSHSVEAGARFRF
jgi:OOP family OmpA-OmpF porin